MNGTDARAAIMEETETYPVIASKTPHKAKHAMAVCQDNPKRTPNPVATLLPPLKPRKGDRLCPKMEHNPESTCQVEAVCIK